MKPQLREQLIIKKAIELSIKKGYKNFTRKKLAKKLNISCSLINHYFKLKELRNIILKNAIESEIPEILAEALVNKDIKLTQLNADVKKKISEYITGI